MARRTVGLTVAGVLIGLKSPSIAAHELLLRYDLPIPFELYLYACAATLIVTFVLFGWLMQTPVSEPVSRKADAGPAEPIFNLSGWALVLLRAIALISFGLTIGVGFFGTRDPDFNISVTLFWQVFLLGLTYATAIIGNVYEFLNPWQVLAESVQRGKSNSSSPRLAYPQSLGYWPAVIFYIAIIWLELFALPRPRVLAIFLIVYSLIIFIGVWLFGKSTWFRYGEVFSVLLRVVGMLAPISYRPAPDGKSFNVYLRWPLIGLLEQRAELMSLVVFVLFMLASTTYDAIHQTIFWMGLFWNRLLVVFQPLWGKDLLAAQEMLERWYVVYQRVGLVLMPFFYLAIYLGVLGLVKVTTRTTIPLRSLAQEFAFSIVPIAFFYNVAHYYTLILTRAPVLPYLLSDPFALGWNPLGLAAQSPEPPVLNMAAVWHTEVALILIGHIVSVYLAHRVALRLFSSRREAIMSEVPVLLLMVAYTGFGLWVISLPFALT